MKLYVFHKKATGIAIYVRDNELYTKQWQCRLPVPTQSPSAIAKEAFSLFMRSYDWKHPIRSLTVRAINLTSLDARPARRILRLVSLPVIRLFAEPAD